MDGAIRSPFHSRLIPSTFVRYGRNNLTISKKAPSERGGAPLGETEWPRDATASDRAAPSEGKIPSQVLWVHPLCEAVYALFVMNPLLTPFV